MMAALNIAQIEEEIRHSSQPRKAALLLFSAYNVEKENMNFEFLRKITDYHYHSQHHMICHCVGYSAYEPSPDKRNGEAIKIPREARSHLSYFYLRNFHDIRSCVSRELMGKWNYGGGIDLLLFPTTKNPKRPIEWSEAAVVSSRKHVGKIFGQFDEMIRFVFNENELYDHLITPDQLRPIINRRIVTNVITSILDRVAPGVFSASVHSVHG